MRYLVSPTSVVAGCIVVALANAVLLSSAARNRGGPPTAALTLTERELALPEGRQDERGALMLGLTLLHDVPGPVRRTARWRRTEIPPVRYPWLDRAKLRELGFRTELDPTDPEAARYYARQVSRPVYLALEYDGEAWARWLAGREAELAEMRRKVEAGMEDRGALKDAEALYDLDRTVRSRLVPVDAGLDARALVDRYPNDGRHAVIEALVRPSVDKDEEGTTTLGGTILGPVVRGIYVPRALAKTLEPFVPTESFRDMEMRERSEAEKGWPKPTPPRYRGNVAVGRRHEPWLTGVTASEDRAAQTGQRPVARAKSGSRNLRR